MDSFLCRKISSSFSLHLTFIRLPKATHRPKDRSNIMASRYPAIIWMIVKCIRHLKKGIRPINKSFLFRRRTAFYYEKKSLAHSSSAASCEHKALSPEALQTSCFQRSPKNQLFILHDSSSNDSLQFICDLNHSSHPKSPKHVLAGHKKTLSMGAFVYGQKAVTPNFHGDFSSAFGQNSTGSTTLATSSGQNVTNSTTGQPNLNSHSFISNAAVQNFQGRQNIATSGEPLDTFQHDKINK